MQGSQCAIWYRVISGVNNSSVDGSLVFFVGEKVDVLVEPEI